MATFRITFNCENDAFVSGNDDNQGPKYEIARILYYVGSLIQKQLPEDGLERSVRDRNGNTVGFWDYV